MTSILSAISGQFSKSLILGTFMPVVFFVILNLFFLLPYLPADPQVLQQISEVNTRAVLVITFVTIVLTGLLYNLNTPIVRLYEGYTWQYSFIGRSRTSRYEEELSSMLELRPRVQDVQDAMNRQSRRASPEVRKTTSTKSRALGSIRNQLGLSVNREFPTAISSVLPTKLGNVIRSFETYPQRQYNMAGITIYPRLIAVVEKEYMEQIDNAKSSLDFMINCSLLSLVLALSMLVAGLVYPIPFSTLRFGVPWALKIAFFFFLSWAFYISSIGRASEWGDLVKGAFDLYRWKLLEQLGFKRSLQNMEEERTLWGAISAQMIFGDRRNARYLEYATATTVALGEPEFALLETSRGLTPTAAPNIVSVTVLVKNFNSQLRAVKNVYLTDTLPAGAEYMWGTGKMIRNPDSIVLSPPVVEDTVLSPPVFSPPVFSPPVAEDIAVTGSNPCRFEIGDLNYGDEVLVTYKLLLK